jgi:ring-1,2-phenylacetyl-CoA epoxidase subunit PaaD
VVSNTLKAAARHLTSQATVSVPENLANQASLRNHQIDATLLEPISDLLGKVRSIAALIPDPEIPTCTLADLGILRAVEQDPETLQIVVTLTPTYSGCPATEAIRSDVLARLHENDINNARVQIQLEPAWTSDWITTEGRDRLREAGIAPPAANASAGNCFTDKNSRLRSLEMNATRHETLSFIAPQSGIRCPLCSSTKSERISQFGSTPCKALYRCLNCKEPFDYFKPI